MTREQAVTLAESRWWEGKSTYEIVLFQLFEERLCLPFDVYHAAIEKELGRPVWTHEFAFVQGLREEFLKDRPAPTMQQIIELIPAEKRLVVGL